MGEVQRVSRTFHYRRWLKCSSGRFHTRLCGCKQPVADVQQARRIFNPCPKDFQMFWRELK